MRPALFLHQVMVPRELITSHGASPLKELSKNHTKDQASSTDLANPLLGIYSKLCPDHGGWRSLTASMCSGRWFQCSVSGESFSLLIAVDSQVSYGGVPTSQKSTSCHRDPMWLPLQPPGNDEDVASLRKGFSPAYEVLRYFNFLSKSLALWFQLCVAETKYLRYAI